ncbi:putative UDP-N-acetyl-D-galactosamine:polypeptide N-acetylgalactosaminyltransferase T5 [Neospora caninum Liverpool]|uniref:Putative UDP-N-acetyl-D-galactosamine:polypeptide N-acetylgalactosaminyltransferase T5 n=1 Tax=Neospora caninum (strain Liverpool) TaxID=572307 RepID=F0VRH5_NEOCL|nr:putative UDP-N-acetyl-D-galactosamine:polypeptide N-acetylgalactosaminyltransferase T5 [Neospora caninum Liverpool]CBZ56323.1 putative UDP-N-acetyl-D-galactosamine:polypeptide N-acetylgalactosaminyltransferase T5 [Neospora caninum Liverpool]CEL71083.1 TPA: UDP-N-acetyl-D-galactosamine:polypeptide N-acetylgalactosaminyltransferase T5, putative [Neospora caninum Liverpool]|eukprot:XP_003886348.1 putative UDP-N-acetyl-D-galactosamine:polypeptide N-acetylgalactosaminyltransferase T5 [Neospora caninum Liverpool]
MDPASKEKALEKRTARHDAIRVENIRKERHYAKEWFKRWGFLAQGEQPENALQAFCQGYHEFVRDFRIDEVLETEYGQRRKAQRYVGSKLYQNLTPGSRGWLNSLAVFDKQEPHRLHGLLGTARDGSPLWTGFPLPPPLWSPQVDREAELKEGGGFYRLLSNALPLDRKAPDSRDLVCRSISYNLQKLSDTLDVSIVIAFYNEPVSTLLRTVHSILNFTPPPLVREVILVNDCSDDIALLPGGFLDQYTPYLPKTSVVHLDERSGVVAARLAGIQAASSPAIVLLDSHVEVNVGWLEPQLQRLWGSPESIVFPQIDSILPTDFSFSNKSGIGCWLSFNWDVQERPTLTGTVSSPDAIMSPVHAGGLLAFRKDLFLRIGGYDKGFTFWGAENVELSFRTWMCGGRLECTPCARVYHLFREGGVGYETPPEALWRNRMRTARLWMDDYYELAAAHNPYHLDHKSVTIGNVEEMEALKKRLNCKGFQWFLNEVDPKHEFRHLRETILGLGHIKSEHRRDLCLDVMNNPAKGNSIGLFYCHGLLGNQGFILTQNPGQVRLLLTEKESHEKLCLTPRATMETCDSTLETAQYEFDFDTGTIRWTGDDEWRDTCMQVVPASGNELPWVKWQPCDKANPNQKWSWPPFPSSRYLPAEEKRRRGLQDEPKTMDSPRVLLRSKRVSSLCVDALSHPDHGTRLGVTACQSAGSGTQRFVIMG